MVTNPFDRNIQRAYAAATVVWDRFLTEGHMDSAGLNKVFAPELIMVGAKKYKSFWILLGDMICSGVSLQRSQWSNDYYINIGACPPYAVPDKFYEFAITDRIDRILTGESVNRNVPMLDFADDSISLPDRVSGINTIAKYVASELLAWSQPAKLQAMADSGGVHVLSEGRDWLRTIGILR